MKQRISLISILSFGLIGTLFGVLYLNTTVTFLDRPFFLSNHDEIIVATRVNWMCNCANYVDVRNYKTNPISEPSDDDYFFIESAQPGLNLHTVDSINSNVRLTGRFYIDKGIPAEYKYGHIEDKPEHARVFRVDEIEYLADDL